jgi:predicted metalloprotease
MRMDGQEESSNVEDVRGMGGGGGGFGFGGRGLSIGGIVIAVIVGWIFGINPLQLLGMMDGSDGGTTVQQQGPAPAPPKEDAGARFVSQVLRSTEQVWTDVFRESGRTYQAPKLVLFSGSWPTACGQGQAAMGPFYCPEGPQGLHRPQLLPRPRAEARRARPVRAGLRRRPRGRPPRPEPARHHGEGRRDAQAAAIARRRMR